MYETARIPRGQVAFLLTVLAPVLVGTSGCSAPAVEGTQIQGAPEGFFFDANAQRSRLVLPERDVLGQGAWWGDIRSEEPQSDLFVTRHGGVATVEEVLAAQNRQATRYGSPTSIDYGDVTSVVIGGRPAWAWMETRYDEHGEVRSLEYTAVIPFDSVSYALQFSTSAPHRLHADSLVRVVHSFGTGEITIHWNAILGSLLVGGGLLLFLVGRTRRPRHDTAYRLASVAKPEEDGVQSPQIPSQDPQ